MSRLEANPYFLQKWDKHYAGLIQFVQKVSSMCRGKAYFTTPDTLGEYLLMDYMQRKMKSIH
ncbi:short form Mg-chelase associated protein with vWA domain [Acidisarcina polymorpha]|uniref:Short form Mg-chelase associated protein with vWA domain n=1 Tax=Acidisarcina polymorpha TaxID=2211140 RepID=A0A2Z5FZ74_9BACT|nr:hypothetical protein [Acidisarcina polymorpha]AXC12030.1 short form Mg-chelase associated protein with vWA domain [Acidisarcina polymorpha]